jgi:maltokinase
MDDRTVLPPWQGLAEPDSGLPDNDTTHNGKPHSGKPDDGEPDEDAPVVVHRYRLSLETAVSVRSDDAGWSCTPERSAGGSVAAEEWGEAAEGDGAAQAFVDLLRYEDLPSVPGFRVVRLGTPPEATGERAMNPDPEDGRTHSNVVVGERVVVAWMRRTVDAPHPGALTLQHLAEHEFMGVPELYGLLLWRTPQGHEVPVATAARYLPRSRDGWAWCTDLIEVAAGLATAPVPVGTPPAGTDLSPIELPARLGRLVAKLHLVLATPSPEDPDPTAAIDAADVRDWQRRIRAVLEADGDTCDAGTSDPDALDGLAEDVTAGRARVLVQRVHGDLHVGRVLRWTRGLSIVGFDAAPAEPYLTGATTLRPAAADVARLLGSLARVAADAARRPDMPADAPSAWYRVAREQVLYAYRSELAAQERLDLLDERLLAAFEAAERAHAARAARTTRAEPASSR